jgi:hypothetical protein
LFALAEQAVNIPPLQYEDGPVDLNTVSRALPRVIRPDQNRISAALITKPDANSLPCFFRSTVFLLSEPEWARPDFDAVDARARRLASAFSVMNLDQQGGGWVHVFF